MSSEPSETGKEGEGEAARHLDTSSLLDLLTPPPGYVVDRALCSAYSGQCSVLVAMLVALVGQAPTDGAGSRALALARALQRLEGRVHFLLQHGRLAGPRQAVRILNMLDRFVVQVDRDERISSWHPKVCVVRCVSKSDKATAPAIWRLWIGSRNFTRDESWDMALALTGQVRGKGQDMPDAVELTRQLAAAAGFEAQWKQALAELRAVRWEVPAGLKVESLALHLTNDEPRDLAPAHPSARDILAVSPFIDGWAVQRLLDNLPDRSTKKALRPRLVSTETCLAEVARHHRPTLDRWDLFSLPPSDQDEKEEGEADAQDAAEDGPEGRGLHAKFLWIETPGRGELRLGSTNLTRRGWTANAEVLAVVSMALPGGQSATALRSGLAAFTNLCIEHKLDAVEHGPDSSQQLRDAFSALRNAVAYVFKASQEWRDGLAIVKVASPPPLRQGTKLRVGRIGDALIPWPAACTELALPPAPMFENGDFLQVELTVGELSAAWLHFAPFEPALSRTERDVPLLHSYLGIEGVLELLNDSLSAGGNAGGERRGWDEPRKSPTSWPSVAQLGIESVLSSWVRDPESLHETSRIVEVARRCKPATDAEVGIYRQLQDFLESWSAVEQELMPR